LSAPPRGGLVRGSAATVSIDGSAATAALSAHVAIAGGLAAARPPINASARGSTMPRANDNVGARTARAMAGELMIHQKMP
jgi:hypothetical protein